MQTHNILLLASSLGFCIGGFFLKRYADTGGLAALAISFTVYLSANLVFARVIAGGLGAGMASASMIQLCVMVILGAVFFGEKLTITQAAGLVCALLAIGLFALQPAQSPKTFIQKSSAYPPEKRLAPVKPNLGSTTRMPNIR